LTNYIIRRLLLNVVVLWFVATIVFFATAVLPGDYAARQVASSLEITDQTQRLEEARRMLGLDKPVHERYADFLAGLATLDLGTSYETGRSSWAEIGRRLPATLELGILITLVAFGTAIPIGVISAVKQDTWIDVVLRTFAVVNLAVPVFVAAILMILIVLKFDLFQINVAGRPHFWTDPGDAARLYVIPAVAGGISAGAGIMRLLRSQMLEVMRNDYIRTARAKGLHDRTVWVRHAVKNAMLPVLTAMGFTITGIVGGQIILENMFNIDGLGRFLFRRLIIRDFPPFQGAVLLIAFVIVTVNLVVDITYGWLDPRIRYS
jgi:peptide/nickel transport system permease protein